MLFFFFIMQVNFFFCFHFLQSSWDLEEKVMLEALKLPNYLHPSTVSSFEPTWVDLLYLHYIPLNNRSVVQSTPLEWTSPKSIFS